MTERITVAISEYRLAGPPTVLATYGLGSCLAIALYDAEARLGALAHTLLPTARGPADTGRPAKFVDQAIRVMAEDLVAAGADRQRLVAKIFGGANMFEPPLGGDANGIGVRNARSAREVLETLGIPLVAEDVGGNFGRTVRFELATGRVQVRAVRGREGETSF